MVVRELWAVKGVVQTVAELMWLLLSLLLLLFVVAVREAVEIQAKLN